MTTLRQIASNRVNALKSTGPTTDEGKAHSRGNALKHGLTGENVVAPDDDAALVAERLRTWRESYRPGSDEAEWLFEQAVVSSVRVERCQLDADRVRARQARRAALCWQDDRRLAAEELGRTLARRPALVLRKLRKTRQGCDWLLDRWRRLADTLDRGGEWTEDQTSLAFDLLGTPPEFRDGAPKPSRDAVAREIAGLEQLCADALDDLDALEREAAEDGLPVEPDRPLALLRRYEAASLRRYQWAGERLHALRREPEPEPPPPAPAPDPEPEPEPARPMTDDDWREYERGIFARGLAKAGITPAAPPQDIQDFLWALKSNAPSGTSGPDAATKRSQWQAGQACDGAPEVLRVAGLPVPI